MTTMLIEPPPPARRRRRGDTNYSGLRTVRKNRIHWYGHDYQVACEPLDPPYNGAYEGLRFVVRMQVAYGGTNLVLLRYYDPAPIAGVPIQHWRRWVRDDVFDD